MYTMLKVWRKKRFVLEIFIHFGIGEVQVDGPTLRNGKCNCYVYKANMSLYFYLKILQLQCTYSSGLFILSKAHLTRWLQCHPLSLFRAVFDPKARTVFLMHGWNSSPRGMESTKNAYMNSGLGYNVIILDWSRGQGIRYWLCASNARVAGACSGKWWMGCVSNASVTGVCSGKWWTQYAFNANVVGLALINNGFSKLCASNAWVTGLLR